MTQEDIRFLLPDYADGMLDEEKSRLVERALADHAELQAELEQIRMVFESFPAERVNRQLAWRSRNISIAVLERLAAPQRSYYRWQYWLLGGAIASALVLVAIIVSLPKHSPPIRPSAQQNAFTAAQSAENSTPGHSHPAVSAFAQRSGAKTVRPAPQLPYTDSRDVVYYDALTMSTFPDSEIDSTFVELFVEVFSDGSIE